VGLLGLPAAKSFYSSFTLVNSVYIVGQRQRERKIEREREREREKEKERERERERGGERERERETERERQIERDGRAGALCNHRHPATDRAISAPHSFILCNFFFPETLIYSTQTLAK
jgi:hypothetical protein